MDTQRTLATQPQEDIVAVWHRCDPADRETFLRRIMPASAFPSHVPLPFEAPRT